MIHGVYLSAQGANAQVVRQDVISNNLANASTTGFKRDLAEFRFHRPEDLRRGMPAHMQGDRQKAHGAITVDRTTTIHTDGPVKSTDQPFDIAIQGDGFLRVRQDDGQEFLTRNGRLRRDETGTLKTEDSNYEVLSASGNPVKVPLSIIDSHVHIGTDGTVAALTPDRKTARTLDRIGLFTAPPERMVKAGRNLFQVDGQDITVARKTTVEQGFLESSSVEPTRELVSLIEASRTFEANINLIKLQDESLGRLLQTMSG